MKTLTKYSNAVANKWTHLLGAMLILALMVPAVAFSQYNNPLAVDLLTAGNFRAFSETDLTVGATCAVTGNVGGHVTVTVIAGGSVSGSTDIANATTLAASNDLNTVFAELLTRTVDETFVAVNLGGLTLGRGVYKADASGTLGINGTLTLTGTATDIFIIRTGTTGTPGTSLITSASSVVTMGGTALASNVYWVIGTSAELAANSTFKGNILAGTTILQNADALFEGRALGKTAVTLNGPGVLPVELVAFTATANRANADLRWSTATEVNNHGFEIERRQNADWAKVGFVSGAGTSNAPRDYSYTDNNLSTGRYTYRLKQVDNNGAFSYHGSVEVAIGSAPQEFALSQNYPNPFNPSTVISYQLPANSQVTLKVYDVLGNEVATLVNGRQEAGSYTVPFSAINGNTSTLASGVYIYRLQAGSFVSTKKLVLMK